MRSVSPVAAAMAVGVTRPYMVALLLAAVQIMGGNRENLKPPVANDTTTGIRGRSSPSRITARWIYLVLFITSNR